MVSSIVDITFDDKVINMFHWNELVSLRFSLKDVIQELPEDERDLHFISSQVTVVQVHIEDLIYDLIGEISSSSEEGSIELEQYLISDSQEMARTKQTAKKTDNKGCLTIAQKSPRCSPRILDSDSSLEAAYDLYTVDPMATRSSTRKMHCKSDGVHIERQRWKFQKTT